MVSKKTLKRKTSIARKTHRLSKSIKRNSVKANYSVIVTASFIKSHPSIDFIKNVIESLKYIHMDKNTPIILAHDYSNDSRFIKYLENLKAYASNNKNIQIIVRDSPGCLTGSIRNAFNHVNTEYVLIIQHDFPFVRNFYIEKVIQDMKANPELKHVRFNKRSNIKVVWDALNNLFGKEIKSLNYKYTRTPNWSDNNHLCRSDYYRDIILKECSDGSFMEKSIYQKIQNEKIHRKYGTYIFGPLNQPAFINHLDGRGKNTVEK